MAKRFTDTDIWKNQRWFRKLNPTYKLCFYYIKDLCNHAGIWNVDCTDLIEDLGIDEFSLPDFVQAVNTEYDKITGKKIFKERIKMIDETTMWITGLIQYQNENKQGFVSAAALPVKSAIQILNGLGVLQEALDKGFLTLDNPSEPLLNPSEPLAEKLATLTEPSERAKGRGRGKGITNTGFIGDSKPVESIEPVREEKLESNEKKEEITTPSPKPAADPIESTDEPVLNEALLSPKMVARFKLAFPHYPIDLDKDYSACLRIAYKIARAHGWTKESVINGKMDDCMVYWDAAIQCIKDDDFLSGMDLKRIEGMWATVVQKMNKPKTQKNGTHQQSATAKSSVNSKTAGAGHVLDSLLGDLVADHRGTASA